MPALPVRPPSGSGRRAAVSSRTPASSGAYPPVGTGGGRGSGSMPVVGGLGGSGIYSSHRGPILGPSDELPDVPPAPKAPAHYDLFFEMEPGDEEHRGLLHFATLDDQPPIGDGELLRLGEMHRRRYLSYEGPVDQERGAVRIVDRGSFRWMPQSDPAAGHFWLFIDGGLLNGIFTISVLPAQLVQVGSEFRFQFQFSEFPA